MSLRYSLHSAAFVVCCCILPGCCLFAQKRTTHADLVIADHATAASGPLAKTLIADLPPSTHLEHVALCEDSLLTYDWDGNVSWVSFRGDRRWQLREDRPGSGSSKYSSAAMCVSPDNRYFANLFQDSPSEVVIRSTNDGSLVTRSDVGGTRTVTGVAFDPCESHTLWVSTLEGHIERWAITTGQLIKIGLAGTFKSEGASILLVVPASREVLAVGNGHVVVWECTTGAKSREFTGDWITRETTLSTDGRRAVSLTRARSDGGLNLAVAARMTVWDTFTGEKLRVIDGWRTSKDNAESIRRAWLIGDHYLAASTASDDARIIDLRDGAVHTELSSTDGVILPRENSTFITSLRDAASNRRQLAEFRVP